MSFKRFLSFISVFLICASPALLGIVPDRIWIFYLPLCLIASLLFALRAAWFKPEWLLFFAMLCVCLSVMDVALRVFGGHLTYPRPEDRYLNRWPVFPELSRFQKNVRFEGEVFGDLAGLTGKIEHQERRRVRFITDALGYRNEPSEEPLVYDVFVVGDSNGAGMNASQERIWPEILRTQYHHRVYNLSTGGSPWDYLMNIKASLPGLKKDDNATLFFVISGCNDLVGRYTATDFKPLPPFSQGMIAYETFRKRSPVRLILIRAFNFFRTVQYPPDSVIVGEFPDKRTILFMREFEERRRWTDGEVSSHKNFQHLSSILRELSAIAKAGGLRVAVVMAPSKEDVYSWVYDGSRPWSADPEPGALSRAIASICASEGMLFGDAKRYFIEESRRLFETSGKILWWYDDTHWNHEGQALFARWIQEQFLDKVTKA